MPAHNPLPFTQVREDLRDLLTMPVQAVMLTPALRRAETEYQELLTIPLDLAACGFTVTVRQLEAGWCIDLERRICTGRTLRLNGHARSYVAALFELAETACKAIDDLERAARREAAEQEHDDLTA